MTKEKLTQANELLKNISELEKIISNCHNQSCELITFTYGNGSDRGSVCKDKNIIEKVRNLLITENIAKLEILKSEFERL